MSLNTVWKPLEKLAGYNAHFRRAFLPKDLEFCGAHCVPTGH